MFFSWSNFFFGLIGLVPSVLLIKYAFYLNHHVYFLDFVERRFGSGTGTLAYRWGGAAAAIFSIFVMFGFVNISDNTRSQGVLNSTQPTNTIPNVPNNNRGNGIAP